MLQSLTLLRWQMGIFEKNLPLKRLPHFFATFLFLDQNKKRIRKCTISKAWKVKLYQPKHQLQSQFKQLNFCLRPNILSKLWLLTCSRNITLSLSSYTGSALKRELNFCNGYLHLPYFCLLPKISAEPSKMIKFRYSLSFFSL